MRPNLYRASPSPSKRGREENKGEASVRTAASTGKHAHLVYETPLKLKEMSPSPAGSFYDLVGTVGKSMKKSRVNSLGMVSFDPSGGDEDIKQA